MAADELRRRVVEEIARRHLNPNAVGERAGLSPALLHKFLSSPEKGLDPPTCRKLAAYFQWPEIDVFRWAELLSPQLAEDPLADLQSALWRMGWSEETSRALYTLAEQLAGSGALARPDWERRAEQAAVKAFRPRGRAADVGALSEDENLQVAVGNFVRYFLAGEEEPGGSD